MSLISPYQSNTNSSISSQDVGVKISIPGTNALTASPTQLIFDSSWPSIPVAFPYLGTFTSATNYAIPHNLGFPAFTKIWLLDSNKNIIQNNAVLVGNYGFDNTNVYIHSLNNTNATYFYINCYNIDVSKDVDYPSLPTVSAKSYYDPNYGIKIAKNNKITSSIDGRDFVLHSRFRSPLIKAVKTQDTSVSSGVVQYVNKDNVATWNYGFLKIGSAIASNLGMSIGSYVYAPYYSQAYPVTKTDGITTYLQFNNSDLGATLVILRDPFFAPTVIQAFY